MAVLSIRLYFLTMFLSVQHVNEARAKNRQHYAGKENEIRAEYTNLHKIWNGTQL